VRIVSSSPDNRPYRAGASPVFQADVDLRGACDPDTFDSALHQQGSTTTWTGCQMTVRLLFFVNRSRRGQLAERWDVMAHGRKGNQHQKHRPPSINKKPEGRLPRSPAPRNRLLRSTSMGAGSGDWQTLRRRSLAGKHRCLSHWKGHCPKVSDSTVHSALALNARLHQ
jgi:hypothetical protein